MGKTKSKRLLCLLLSLAMVFALISVPVYAEEAEAVEEAVMTTDADAATEETAEDDAFVLFAESIFPTDGALMDGTYQLTGDEAVESGLTVSDGTVTIDLAGNTLTADITVSGGTLTITDSAAEANVSSAEGGTVVGGITVSGGHLTIEGGYYTGTLTGEEQSATIEFATFASKITAAETVLGYADSGDYFYYQNPDESYVYTKSARYVSVTIDDITTYYTDFGTAMADANAATAATVTALDNSYACLDTVFTLHEGIEITGDVTLDLSKCAVIQVSSAITTDYIFQVCSSGSLTVKNCENTPIGSSSKTSTENGGIGILVDGGTLTLDDYSSVEGYYAVKVTNSGTVYVSGREAGVKGSDTGIYVESGTVNIACNSGGVSGTSYGVYLAGSDCTLTVSDGDIESDGYGVYSNGAEVNVNGGTVSGDTYGIYADGGAVNMSSGTVTAYSSTEAALYVTGSCEFNMTGGTIEGGNTGLSVVGSESTATITGSVAISGTQYAVYTQSGTVEITNVGTSEIGMTNNYCVYADGGTVTIDSGWYTGSTTECIGTTGDGSVTITGGTYSSDVSDYCTTGCTVTEENGTYSVEAPEDVATVTDKSGNVTYYTTLAAAAEYAKSLATGSSSNTTTITLLGDITLTEQVALENAGTSVRVYLTLDLDGHTITADVEDGYALYIKSTDTSGYGKITVENGTITATANAYGAIEIDHGAAILTDLTLSSRTAGHGTILVDSVTGTAAEFTDLTITTTDGYCLEVNNTSNTATLKLSGTQKYTQTASDDADDSQLNACVYLHGSTGMSASAQTDSDINWSSDGYGVYISGNRVYFNKTVSGKIEGQTKGIYVDSSYDNSTYAAVTVVAASTIAVDGGIESAASAYDNYAIAISGGNYEYELNEAYVASGYKCVLDETEGSDTNGRYIIEEEYVAEVYNGTTLIGSYNSLSGAISAATSGYTVKLIKDCSGSSTITISKNLTIDLNGNTYAYTGSSNAFTLNNSNYTVTITDTSDDGDGKIEAMNSNAIAVVVKRGTLNVESTATISASIQGIQLGGYSAAYSSSIKAVVNVEDNATVYGGETGVGIYGSTSSSATANSYGPTLNVTGGTVSGRYYGISGQGSTTYKGNTFINISGGTVVGTGSGIYHPQLGTLTVSGGTITGEDAGIEMRAGTLNVSGGEITSTSTDATTYVANGSGTTVVGAGIAISQHSTNNAITLNVTGGTISGATGIYEVNTFAGTNTSAVTINISEADTATPTIVKSIIEGGTAVKSESVNGETTGASSITTVAISGGHFSSEVDEAYCAEGYAPATETEETYAGIMYTVKETKYVASVTIGEDIVSYTTIADAVDAANNASEDATITLLDDVTFDDNVTISNTTVAITLDLNGYDLTNPSEYTLTIAEGASVTMVDNVGGGIVYSYGTITVSGTLDISELGYTTDTSSGGLMGQLSGRTVMGAAGTFVVPNAWETEWKDSFAAGYAAYLADTTSTAYIGYSDCGEDGIWSPNVPSATGVYGSGYVGIFYSAEVGATVVSGSNTWTCTTAFENLTENPTTLCWTMEEEEVKDVYFYGASLLYEDIIQIRYYAYIADSILVNGDAGVIIGSAEDITLDTEGVLNCTITDTSSKSGDYYYVDSDGIPAKNMGDMQYAMIYYTDADGETQYSDPLEYSPKIYAYTKLKKSDDTKTRDLAAALLNYGAAAQTYFGYDTDNLMNAELSTYGYSTDVSEYYDESVLSDYQTYDTSKTLSGAVASEDITLYGRTTVFKGALQLNMYFSGLGDAENRGIIYWQNPTEDELSVSGKTGEITSLTKNGSYYYGTITGIAAKDMSDRYYVCAYAEDSEGNRTYSAVYEGNIYGYAYSRINNSTNDNMVALAKWLVVYGEAAKACLGE